MGCGEWQCAYGAWHDAGEKCDCEIEERPAGGNRTGQKNVTNSSGIIPEKEKKINDGN